jgi:hypothetical protein
MHPSDIFKPHFLVPKPAKTAFESVATGLSETAERKAANWWRRPFPVKEVILLSIFVLVLGAVSVALLAHYPYYPCCFHQLSAAIRHWDFRGLHPSQPKELWGYSYVSALVATVTRLPDIFAIIVVSSVTFVIANYFCCYLFGTTVAAWFVVINWWWIDVAVEGMTEPLFMALLLGSFIAVRKERWMIAAVLASSATVVRPVGIFALVAIAVVLINRRELRRLIATIAIGCVTGILYAIPVMLVYGDPFANVRGYRTQDWAGSLPVTIPFLPLIKGALTRAATVHLKLQILIGLWVLLTLAGMIKMAVDKRFWRYSKEYPVEAIFAGLYAIFLFSYNTTFWGWEHFPRFVIPLLPFLLLVFLDYLPRDRRIVWGVALANVALSVWPKL